MKKNIKRLISYILSFVILFTCSTQEYAKAANENYMQNTVQITVENSDNNINAVRMCNTQTNYEYFLSVEKTSPELNIPTSTIAVDIPCKIKLLVKSPNENVIDEEFTGKIIKPFSSQDLKDQLTKLSNSHGDSQQEFVDFLNTHIDIDEDTNPTSMYNQVTLSTV